MYRLSDQRLINTNLIGFCSLRHQVRRAIAEGAIIKVDQRWCSETFGIARTDCRALFTNAISQVAGQARVTAKIFMIIMPDPAGQRQA